MRIESPRTNTDKLVFGQDFINRQSIQSNGGIITACSVQAGDSRRSDFFIDGNMEASGTAAYTPTTVNLSKSAVNPHSGLQSLQLDYNGSSALGQASQGGFVIGRTYSIQLYYYSDGVSQFNLTDGGAVVGTYPATLGWNKVNYTGIWSGTSLGLRCPNLANGVVLRIDDITIQPLDGGNGISPTGATGLITFKGTNSLLTNSSKMTVIFNLQTPFILGAINNSIICKTPSSLADNQFFIETQSPNLITAYIASSASDASNWARIQITTASKLFVAIVYDGTLSAANRLAFYINGNFVSIGSSGGTIPASMRSGGSPITIFNRDGGTVNGPPTDFILYNARIYQEAFSAQQVTDDYLQQTYQKVFGGGA